MQELHEIYNLALPYSLNILPTICHIKFLSLYPILKSFIPLIYYINKPMSNKLWPFKKRYLATVFSKSFSVVMKLSKMLIKLALQNYITISIFFLVLNVSLISNKAPKLHSVICSEVNTASITEHYCKGDGVVISSLFLWKLLLFIAKKIYNVLCNFVCDILCLKLLESINSHS